jgi:hypothetical protein
MRYLIPLIVAVAGCANVRPPVDVTLVPNDCANQTAIVNWLEEQGKISPSTFSDKDQYARHRASIRQRIWNMRYTCNPADYRLLNCPKNPNGVCGS